MQSHQQLKQQYLPLYTGIAFGLICLSFILYCYLHGFRIFVITSGSMEPALTAGAVIATQPQARYYQGQVITYYASKPTNQPRNASQTANGFTQHNSQGSQLVITHRIVSSLIKNERRKYTTQGDSNPYPDQNSVDQDDVIGRVRLAIPWLGFIFTWLYSKLGFYFLVLLPLMLVMMFQLKNIIAVLLNSSNHH